MNILIDQAGFINKGAELMLRSVVEQLKQRYPTAQLVMPHGLFSMDSAGYCAKNKIIPMRRGLKSSLLRSYYRFCMFFGSKKKYGSKLFAMPKDIDVIIDAGGFRFGDQWQHTRKSNRRLLRYYNSFKKTAKLVLLPQSFGPFAEPESIKAMTIMLEKAGLVYARELISMDYLKMISSPSAHVEFKRDFTLIHKCETFIASIMPKGKYIVIVPNKKMITHASLGAGAYLQFICSLVKTLNDEGEQTLLLNHEGSGDYMLCEEINRSLNLKLPIISNLGAMHVKNVIGNAKLLISSRFHGVVSGITQGVPTLCTSWSHKYNELVEAYGLKDNLLDIANPDDAIARVEHAIMTPNDFIAPMEMIESEKQSIAEMWQEVFHFIDSDSPVSRG